MRHCDDARPAAWDEWAERTLRRMAWLLVLVVSLFVATDLVARLGRVTALQPVSFRQLASDILFAIGFGSPIVLYLSARPPIRRLAAAAAAGAMLSGLIFGALGTPTAAGAIIGLGLGCLAVLAWDSIAGGRDARLYWRLFLLPSAVALVYTLQAAVFLNYLAFSVPQTFDGHVYVADGGYGFQPSFTAGRWFAAVPPLAWICYAIYAAPPPILMYVYALQVRAPRPPRIDAITTLLVLGLSGYAFYFLYPVTGPLFAFGDAFPDTPPPTEALSGRLIEVPPLHPTHVAWRNAMPSLHFGSVLLALWLSRPLGRWPQIVSRVIVAGTALATLGLGEHYAIDLVVALPFTLAIHALTQREPAHALRWRVVIVSVVLVAVWYALLFTATGWLGRTPLALWTVTVTTIVGVWALERRLARPMVAAGARES
jgi:hypothetical protein